MIKDGKHPSFITFNGANTTDTYCGDNGIIYVDNEDMSDWKVRIKNMTLGDKDFPTTNSDFRA